MREISADAWTVECDVLCITTNGTVSNGRNVMGAGIAGEAARRYRDLPDVYGDLISSCGHHVYLIQAQSATHSRPLLMFPTKDKVMYPASMDRIYQSMDETCLLAEIYGWKTIALPRPGSGLGGLDWNKEVKPALDEWYDDDDRFLIVSYPGEK